jgi:transposase
VVRAKEQKVAALRRVLREHAKSDRIDALTLAKLPWVDPEHLEPFILVSPEIQRLDRLTRRRDLLAASVGRRKTHLSSLLMGMFPGMWECFEAPFNKRARWAYRHCLNPFRVERMKAEQMEKFSED